jgi:transcription elongation factor Elf1
MSNWGDQRCWDDSKVLERITRAYSREDDQFQMCPRCGDIARQQSVNDGSDVKRELRCTNCGHMERTTVVKTTETGVEVTVLPFECRISGLNSSGEKLAAWLLWYDRYQEVAGCR